MYNKYWDYQDKELINMASDSHHMEAEEVRELARELGERLENVLLIIEEEMNAE